MSSSTGISAHAALLRTVQDIQDRAEIEACLRDMLIDVELSIHLQEKLHTHHQMQALRKRIQEQEYVIAETKAVRKESQQQQVALAEALMSELMELSVEMGTLKEMKLQYEKLMIQYDEVVAKLIQAEEDRNSSNTVSQAIPPLTTDSHSDAAKATVELDTQLVVAVDSSSPLVDSGVVDPNSHADSVDPSIGVSTEVQPASDPEFAKLETDPSPAPEPTPNGTLETMVVPNIHIETTTTGSTDELELDSDDTVALVKEIRFDEFEKDIFLKIFSYLDALDILNTAQINVSMYSRVDSFFDSADTQDDGNIEQSSSSSLLSLDIPVNDTLSTHPTAVSNDVADGGTTLQPDEQLSKVVSSSFDIHQPTVVALPPVSSTKSVTTSSTTTATATTKPSIPSLSTPVSTAATPSLMAVPALTSPPKHATSKSNDSAILNRSIFSLLQPRQRPITNTSAAINNAGSVSPVPSPARHFLRPLSDSKTSTPVTGNNNSNTNGPLTMNAAMANSMAAKLSDAELNAIILMTERLKQKEIIAENLAKENERLLAKLDGTEGVKQFLINKVRDMEVSLSALIQNETKVVQQIASDQEVIAFLDGRVQELEHLTQMLQTEKEVVKTDLERVQNQSAQKVTVISDMLQFEREKLADQEREWKMTKKLLVKEVKNCRSQIVALQSERDGYREQSDTLRRALLSPSSSLTSSNHHHSNGNSSKHRDRAFA